MTYKLLYNDDIESIVVDNEFEARMEAVKKAYEIDNIVILMYNGKWLDAFYGPTLNSQLYHETLGEYS